MVFQKPVKNTLLVVVLLVWICGVFIPQAFAWYLPGYHTSTQYISELGAKGAPSADIINYGGFLPAGIGIMLFSYMLFDNRIAHSTLRKGGLFYSGVGIAYVGSVLFPCIPGCPLHTTNSLQIIHNIVAVFEYGGGIAALFFWSRWCRKMEEQAWAKCTYLALIVVLLTFTAMLLPDFRFIRGILQRIADYTLIAWMLIPVFALSRRNIPGKY